MNNKCLLLASCFMMTLGCADDNTKIIQKPKRKTSSPVKGFAMAKKRAETTLSPFAPTEDDLNKLFVLQDDAKSEFLKALYILILYGQAEYAVNYLRAQIRDTLMATGDAKEIAGYRKKMAAAQTESDKLYKQFSDLKIENKDIEALVSKIWFIELSTDAASAYKLAINQLYSYVYESIVDEDLKKGIVPRNKIPAADIDRSYQFKKS